MKTSRKRQKIIQSAHVQHHKSGITSVVINLLEKSCSCYRSGSDSCGKASHVTFAAGLRRRKMEEYVVETTKLKSGIWLSMREKDQAHFYHIPFTLLCDEWRDK